MSKDRNCKMCVYYSENGCSQFNCQGTTTVDDIKAEERAYILKMIETIESNNLYCLEDMCNNSHKESGCAECALEYVIKRLKEQK